MELTAQKREVFGKSVKKIRKEGLIPAELYGHGVKNEHLSVSVKEFNKVFKEAGESTVINLNFEGQKKPVLVQYVGTNPRTDEILAVDFYEVNLSERINVNVPIEFTGEAPAVKEKSGILIKALQELEIEALPTDIPREITVDLSSLAEIGSSIHVGDIIVPKNVKVLVDAETVVATITEQEAEEEAAGSEITVDDIKVEGEEKRAERTAKKEGEETSEKS
ncbi:MAG: 50S ribosomal protein L25 [Candidatus Harrisonbacteria bacterium CG10_big_fil_rev_8_21_14_0_10_40_38]|uniref:Large ribosomal subunit protein bL25 n=1 Tax=Candidatus Harrisonbacteria bacterium CG10_big_fil_rev_8_21_14_0_10_40_38 TaxID=1974583 RepID=A0A2H0UR58_9BACT|nr:MAG: 50S ribosomal protein L25 [Candidatus Harrisonbacteria bacterium CG10_big_fil_rev_8_21_14_0_10_40_38]